jgi:alpha-ribazole phosphatase
VVIALFRHGITIDNKRKAYLGWTDSPLCLEAQNLKTNHRYDGYYASDLQRCIDTVKILFPEAKPNLLTELREMNFGQWEGKTYEFLKEDSRYCRWLEDPVHHSPPNGESFLQFTQRVQDGWRKITDEILSHHFRHCAIITHGGVVRYLLSQFAPEKKEFWSWSAPHEQGFELIFNREMLREGKRCTSLQVVPLMEKDYG